MIRFTHAAIAPLRLLAASVLAIAATTGAMAQDAGSAAAAEIGAEISRIGVTGAYGLIGYTADFTGLPGVPSCCPEYRDGKGDAIAFGVAAETRLMPNLHAGLRVMYASYGGTLTADEQRLVTSGDDTTTATFRHTIDAAQPAIAAEATVGYRVIGGLSVNAGLRGDFMLGGTYHQKEEIASPATIRYENDQRQRLVFDGPIPQELRMHMALIAGVRYDLPLNGRSTLLLSPELQLWQGLGDLVDGVTWKMRGARLGLTLSFVMRDATREPSPLAPGRIAEPEKPAEPAKPAEPEQKPEPRKPNSGSSSNSDIPNSHP